MMRTATIGGMLSAQIAARANKGENVEMLRYLRNGVVVSTKKIA